MNNIEYRQSEGRHGARRSRTTTGAAGGGGGGHRTPGAQHTGVLPARRRRAVLSAPVSCSLPPAAAGVVELTHEPPLASRVCEDGADSRCRGASSGRQRRGSEPAARPHRRASPLQNRDPGRRRSRARFGLVSREISRADGQVRDCDVDHFRDRAGRAVLRRHGEITDGRSRRERLHREDDGRPSRALRTVRGHPNGGHRGHVTRNRVRLRHAARRWHRHLQQRSRQISRRSRLCADLARIESA